MFSKSSSIFLPLIRAAMRRIVSQTWAAQSFDTSQLAGRKGRTQDCESLTGAATHNLVSAADGEGHAGALEVLVLGLKGDVGRRVVAWTRRGGSKPEGSARSSFVFAASESNMSDYSHSVFC